MKNSPTVLLLAVVLTACATTPISPTKAKQVSADRIFLTEKVSVEGSVRVIFVRDTGMNSSGVYQHVYIDGKKAASLNPGEKVEFVLAPGEHIFGSIPTDVLGVSTLNTIDQDLKAGRTYYYRIQTDNHFRTEVQRFVPNDEQR